MESGTRAEDVATYGAFDFLIWVGYKDFAPTELEAWERMPLQPFSPFPAGIPTGRPADIADVRRWLPGWRNGRPSPWRF
jgi:hypothetical protein